MILTNLVKILSQSSTSLSRRFRSEFRHFKDFPDEILSLFPTEENLDLKQWTAMIKGPMGTPYENGLFTLSIICESDYPLKPPKITFETKVFHPNINSKGEICLDTLQNGWTPACTLQTTLLSICSLLSDPNIDDFLVPEAAYLYKNDRQEYNRKAREWTNKYAMGDDQRTERQSNSRELDELNDTIARMNVSSSSSNQNKPQQVMGNNASGGGRSARFNVIEPLQVKTFDNGESKEYVPIIAKCLTRKERDRHETCDPEDELNINHELQLFILALEKEGQKLRKQSESELLINELYTLIDLSPDIVGQGCLHLYSMETFLYFELNQFLREADHSKTEIYGPFVRLLYFYFNHPSSTEIHSIEVYRGMNLSSSMINAYKAAEKDRTSFRWAGFSSTSCNLQFAKDFNTNTLFIIQLRKIYSQEKKAIDISQYSQFPYEKEVLLKAGVEFTVEIVTYDEEEGKHNIYLNLYV